jgi:hypothetical protein
MIHSQLIQALYVVLIFLAFMMEMSHKVDTDHIFKKVGLLFIFIGSILHIAHRENPFVPAGLAFYFGIIVIRALANRYGRRSGDRRALNGKR